MSIHYISYYADADMNDHYQIVRSSISKIRYIADVLKDIDADMTIVSTANAKKGIGYLKHIKKDSLYVLPSIGLRGKLYGRVAQFFMQLMLLRYLLTRVKNDDQVVFYHSISYYLPIVIAKRLKKMRLIMEYNDKYSYHFTNERKAKKIDKIEKKMISVADAYIFASPIMKQSVEKEKPFAVNYGSYEKSSCLQKKINIDKTTEVNVLYSGVIEPLRQAAEIAVESSVFLPDEYVLHIAGFGGEDYVDKITKRIRQINEEKKRDAIVYHGFLDSSQLEELMQSCEIAVSTHKYDQEWMSELSFPSKIPLNMAHGLFLVSPKIAVVYNSPFSRAACFYTEHTPEALAGAIEQCHKKIVSEEFSQQPEKIVENLDLQFRQDMQKLILNGGEVGR